MNVIRKVSSQRVQAFSCRVILGYCLFILCKWMEKVKFTVIRDFPCLQIQGQLPRSPHGLEQRASLKSQWSLGSLLWDVLPCVPLIRKPVPQATLSVPTSLAHRVSHLWVPAPLLLCTLWGWEVGDRQEGGEPGTVHEVWMALALLEATGINSCHGHLSILFLQWEDGGRVSPNSGTSRDPTGHLLCRGPG